MKNTRNDSAKIVFAFGRFRAQTTTVCVAFVLAFFSMPTLQATLPAIPKGVAALGPTDGSIDSGILSNATVDIISVGYTWPTVETADNTYSWSALTTEIGRATTAGKTVLLRLGTMGGSASNGGSTPDWVFDAMGVSHTSTTATPGVTYSFANGASTTCIPVFWQSVYLAKKKALIANAGSQFGSNTTVKIFVTSVANAISEDWNVPHGTTGTPSQTQLWQNAPTALPYPGAGYTTQKMLDAAIHQTASASFTDGSVTGMTLTSSSAVFTQADKGKGIGGTGYKSNTHIVGWVSTTQVTLDKTLNSGTGASFNIVNRDDGILDVAMAAFPNQYIALAVGGSGPNLDGAAASADCTANPGSPNCSDPDDYLARQIGSLVQTKYPGRYITARNSVNATMPLKSAAGTGWLLLAEASNAGYYTSGQARSAVYNDGGLAMNGGDNCNKDNALCTPAPCSGTCALNAEQVLDKSADHLATYTPSYYEIYKVDALNITGSDTYIHNLFNP